MACILSVNIVHSSHCISTRPVKASSPSIVKSTPHLESARSSFQNVSVHVDDANSEVSNLTQPNILSVAALPCLPPTSGSDLQP